MVPNSAQRSHEIAQAYIHIQNFSTLPYLSSREFPVIVARLPIRLALGQGLGYIFGRCPHNIVPSSHHITQALQNCLLVLLPAQNGTKCPSWKTVVYISCSPLTFED